MKVATKLAGAFALHIALLAGLMIYHVRTLRDVVSTGHELTGISARVYSTATEQGVRITQLEENAAKYIVTRDEGYRARVQELSNAFTLELARLRQETLTRGEQRELALLTAQWRDVGGLADRVTALALTPDSVTALGLEPDSVAAVQADSVAVIQAQMDSLRARLLRLGEASNSAMLAQLGRSSGAARRAERLSWLAAGGALVLSVLISVLIVRSITEALDRLKVGTREVARGRFGYRLDSSRGDEFAQVARDFNTMTARLDELERMKRDFVSKVSHDLKTPLASMQETIDAMLDEVAGPLSARQRRLLELNYQSGERLYGMLNKLLDLSGLEAGAVPPRMERCDIAHLVRQAAEMHSAVGSEIRVRVPADGLVIHCDADRVLQLLHNLIENAVKYASADGVEVSASRATGEARAVHIVVSDDGPGIPDEEKTKVFERFYQGEAGRTARSRGVGLGLTICREIVSVHGGSIHVEDRAGGGSDFHVVLPDAGAPSLKLVRTGSGRVTGDAAPLRRAAGGEA